MGKSVNKTILLGNVGNDPEIRTTGGGTKMAKLNLATNESFKDRNGERQERTEWHRLVFWDKLADIVEQYVQKGDRLYVEGSIRYSQTEDDKGNVKYWTDINVRDLTLLGGSGGGGAPANSKPSAGRPAKRAAKRAAPAGSKRGANPFDSDDDELPF